MSPLQTATVVVPGEAGLHMVPCSLIAQTVAPFQSTVRLRLGNRVAVASNIFDLIGLVAGRGARLQVEADGADAQAAVQALVALFESGFNGHAERTHAP